MEKLKDWFYNYSDIFVGALITAFAGIVIFGSVNNIMSFSNSFTAMSDGSNQDDTPVIYGTSSSSAVTDAAAASASAGGISTGGVSAGTPAALTPSAANNVQNGTPANNTIRPRVTIVIPSGSAASQIAQLLKDNGLITDTNDFLSVLAASKLDSKLRSGTFTIPEGSNVTEIIGILTGR